jgi:hypothetical protein
MIIWLCSDLGSFSFRTHYRPSDRGEFSVIGSELLAEGREGLQCGSIRRLRPVLELNPCVYQCSIGKLVDGRFEVKLSLKAASEYGVGNIVYINRNGKFSVIKRSTIRTSETFCNNTRSPSFPVLERTGSM